MMFGSVPVQTYANNSSIMNVAVSATDSVNPHANNVPVQLQTPVNVVKPVTEDDRYAPFRYT
ncbi:MAG: hypothetical protein FWF50_04160 [Defluviitaleaceae bacterium]|nr:hypothetical protein [Defluviitaleaceae bacterium]